MLSRRSVDMSTGQGSIQTVDFSFFKKKVQDGDGPTLKQLDGK